MDVGATIERSKKSAELVFELLEQIQRDTTSGFIGTAFIAGSPVVKDVFSAAVAILTDIVDDEAEARDREPAKLLAEWRERFFGNLDEAHKRFRDLVESPRNAERN